ncbi:MAG: methylmalonyl Co-A mutase-associated GTPase MeaB, partial [Sulfitobacter sp.]
GMAEAWASVQELTDWRKEHGFWDKTRSQQAQYWFEQDVRHGLLAQLEHPKVRAALTTLAAQVAAGEKDPTVAARGFLAKLSDDGLFK